MEIREIKKQAFDKIYSAVISKGERFPKKHGSWIKLDVGNGYSFCMDSWNGHINYISNAVYDTKNGFYSYNAFTGDSFEFIGDPDRHYDSAIKVTAHRILELVEVIKKSNSEKGGANNTSRKERE